MNARRVAARTMPMVDGEPASRFSNFTESPAECGGERMAQATRQRAGVTQLSHTMISVG
jgi:hypothetical protein